MEEIYKNLSLENLEGEIWKDIEGFEGMYEVSNFGRVKSLNYNRTNQEKILKQGKLKNGYLLVAIYKEGIRKNCKVHRLVANAFIPNPNNLPMINHKDECKTNNCVENLEWCTYQYNNTYGTAIQRRVASTNYNARTANTDYKAIGRKNAEKLTNRQDLSKQVYQYTLDGELVAIWESTKECGRNGFIQIAVCDCCNGKRKTHKGYIWSYNKL